MRLEFLSVGFEEVRKRVPIYPAFPQKTILKMRILNFSLVYSHVTCDMQVTVFRIDLFFASNKIQRNEKPGERPASEVPLSLSREFRSGVDGR
jgi:hypothetical protein